MTVIRSSPCENDVENCVESEHYIEATVFASMAGAGYTDGIDVQAITLDTVKHATANDEDSQMIIKTTLDGFPEDKQGLATVLEQYWKHRNELSVVNGVLLYNNRIVIPKSLRKEVLDSLHSAHQGVAGMKARARASVFWPGINAAISS